jgi:dCTP deaminase
LLLLKVLRRYLSNRDIKWAIDCGKLTVDPRPEDLTPAKGYDETSIDLHLGPINAARVWNLDELRQSDKARGTVTGEHPPELHIGTFEWESLSDRYLIPVPEGDGGSSGAPRLVYRRGHEIIVRQLGFLLWTTQETIGTPKVMPDFFKGPRRHPELICFINGKSTRARTGLLVHFTAPTIHAGWEGKVTRLLAEHHLALRWRNTIWA